MRRGRWLIFSGLAFAAGTVILAAGCTRTGESARGTRTAQDPALWPASFELGAAASQAEIAALDDDVRPDGRGLPPGSGTPAQGKVIYRAKCAACHGATGTEGPFDKLIGTDHRQDFAFGRDTGLLTARTIGNYWPYATTLYDYIQRAMPFDTPGSLQPTEIYSVVAHLLYSNEIIPYSAVMDARTLPAVKMPARDRFVVDDRRGGQEIK